MDSTQKSVDGRPANEVLITWPDYDAADEELGGALARVGFHLRLEPKTGPRTPRQVARLATRAVGAIVSTDPFDADVFARCPYLRVVARVGVGTDSIDLEAATASGVAVTITPGANEPTVADHAMSLMLAVLRRTIELDRSVRGGKWQRTGIHTSWALHGGTVGLVGYGRTGRLVAQRLRGFDVRVLVNDVVDARDKSVEQLALPDLLKQSDVVSLHVPLSPATRNLIGRNEIELMPPHAILVNCARGGIVDEGALVRALATGRLRGAGLDVFEDEPPRSLRLMRLSNVVLSPHIAGLSDVSIRQMTRRATRSLLDVCGGRRPPDLANPAVVEHPRFGVRGVAATGPSSA